MQWIDTRDRQQPDSTTEVHSDTVRHFDSITQNTSPEDVRWYNIARRYHPRLRYGTPVEYSAPCSLTKTTFLFVEPRPAFYMKAIGGASENKGGCWSFRDNGMGLIFWVVCLRHLRAGFGCIGTKARQYRSKHSIYCLYIFFLSHPLGSEKCTSN